MNMLGGICANRIEMRLESLDRTAREFCFVRFHERSKTQFDFPVHNFLQLLLAYCSCLIPQSGSRCGKMKAIKLQRSGEVAVVDDSDFGLVSRFVWHLRKSKKHRYAYTSVNSKPVYMHKLLLKRRGFKLVDHKDGDGLNNRRANLRPCTYAQNQFNQRKHRGLSQYKGVYRLKSSGKWVARIGFDYKDIYLGTFTIEKEAARAYDQKARELFKEYARLNFDA